MLSTLLVIPVISTIPQALNCPFSHPYSLGVTYLETHTSYLKSADVIVVIDSGLPWLPGNQAPPSSARIFVIDDADPLQASVGYSGIPAELVCRADAEIALTQLVEAIQDIMGQGTEIGEGARKSKAIQDRGKTLREEHQKQIELWDALEVRYLDSSKESTLSLPALLGTVRKGIQTLTPSKGHKVLFLNESVTNFTPVWNHIRPETPGHILSSGGSSLGWSLGAAVGASLGAQVSGKDFELIVVVVGDGSFMFSVPSTAFWMARRYQTVRHTITETLSHSRIKFD